MEECDQLSGVVDFWRRSGADYSIFIEHTFQPKPMGG